VSGPPLRPALGALLLALALPLAAWANDPSPGKAGASSWEAGDGVKLVFNAPPGVTPLASAQLPEIDTSQLAGSRVALRRGLLRAASGPDHQGLHIYAACLRAPAAGLPPDIEELAFARLDERMQQELGRKGSQVEFSPGSTEKKGLLIARPFDGEATPQGARPGVKFRLHGRHSVGFVGTPAELLVCSFSCVEASTEGSRTCPPIVDGASLEAAFVPEPKSSLVARLAFASVRRPLAAVGVVLGLLLMAVGAAITLWPAKK